MVKEAATGADACALALKVPSTVMISIMAACTCSGTVCMYATRFCVMASIRARALISARLKALSSSVPPQA